MAVEIALVADCPRQIPLVNHSDLRHGDSAVPAHREAGIYRPVYLSVADDAVVTIYLFGFNVVIAVLPAEHGNRCGDVGERVFADQPVLCHSLPRITLVRLFKRVGVNPALNQQRIVAFAVQEINLQTVSVQFVGKERDVKVYAIERQNVTVTDEINDFLCHLTECRLVLKELKRDAVLVECAHRHPASRVGLDIGEELVNDFVCDGLELLGGKFDDAVFSLVQARSVNVKGDYILHSYSVFVCEAV